MYKTFQKGHPEGAAPCTYPVVYADIPRNTGMVNVDDGKNHSVPPPPQQGTQEFEDEANALVRVAMDVERDIWPEWYLEFCGVDTRLSPILEAVGLSESDPKGCANAVQMDQPGELWAAILRWTAVEGIKIAPQSKGVRFLERNVDPWKVFGDELAPAMRKAFQVKYYYGQPRPEEYFDSANFAHYPEGCPAHCSYIAGHGTVGGVAAGCFRKVFTEATHEQIDAVNTATLQFSHFRDFARVHYRADSREGWLFGVENSLSSCPN